MQEGERKISRPMSLSRGKRMGPSGRVSGLALDQRWTTNWLLAAEGKAGDMAWL